MLSLLSCKAALGSFSLVPSSVPPRLCPSLCQDPRLLQRNHNQGKDKNLLITFLLPFTLTLCPCSLELWSIASIGDKYKNFISVTLRLCQSTLGFFSLYYTSPWSNVNPALVNLSTVNTGQGEGLKE